MITIFVSAELEEYIALFCDSELIGTWVNIGNSSAATFAAEVLKAIASDEPTWSIIFDPKHYDASLKWWQNISVFPFRLTFPQRSALNPPQPTSSAAPYPDSL
jgi:hypothetical protein